MNTFQQPPQIVSSSNSGSHDAILSLVQSPLSLSSGKNKSAFAPVMRPLDHQSSLSANGCLSLATNGGMMHGEWSVLLLSMYFLITYSIPKAIFINI